MYTRVSPGSSFLPLLCIVTVSFGTLIWKVALSGTTTLPFSMSFMSGIVLGPLIGSSYMSSLIWRISNKRKKNNKAMAPCEDNFLKYHQLKDVFLKYHQLKWEREREIGPNYTTFHFWAVHFHDPREDFRLVIPLIDRELDFKQSTHWLRIDKLDSHRGLKFEKVSIKFNAHIL